LSTEMLESITQTTLMEPPIYLSATAGQLAINQDDATLVYIDEFTDYEVNLKNIPGSSTDIDVFDVFSFTNPSDENDPWRSYPSDTSTEQSDFFRVYDLE